MNDHETLIPKQLRTIHCLLKSPSFDEGCKRARVGKATVYRWLRQDAFRSELETRRRDIVELAVTKALQILVKQLDNKKGTMSLRAAESIIEFAERGMKMGQNKKLPVRETYDVDSLLTEHQKEQIKYVRERSLALKSSGGIGWDRHKD